MRRPALLLLALALGAGLAAWWLQPEKVLARRVAALVRAASVEADAGNLTRGTRGNALEGFLAPHVTLAGPDQAAGDYNGPQSRSSLVSLYSLVAKECRRISLQKPAIDRIERRGDQATVTARVDAVVELPGGSRPADGIQHLTMEWREIDDQWRLAAVRWHEAAR